jgi:hypothetical protein
VRCPHGIEKLRIFGSFHGDLSEEVNMGKLCQARHQFEPFRAHGLKFMQTG